DGSRRPHRGVHRRSGCRVRGRGGALRVTRARAVRLPIRAQRRLSPLLPRPSRRAGPAGVVDRDPARAAARLQGAHARVRASGRGRRGVHDQRQHRSDSARPQPPSAPSPVRRVAARQLQGELPARCRDDAVARPQPAARGAAALLARLLPRTTGGLLRSPGKRLPGRRGRTRPRAADFRAAGSGGQREAGRAARDVLRLRAPARRARGARLLLRPAGGQPRARHRRLQGTLPGGIGRRAAAVLRAPAGDSRGSLRQLLRDDRDLNPVLRRHPAPPAGGRADVVTAQARAALGPHPRRRPGHAPARPGGGAGAHRPLRPRQPGILPRRHGRRRRLRGASRHRRAGRPRRLRAHRARRGRRGARVLADARRAPRRQRGRLV
ncbi:MAG: Long-chain-fatty-acid--luciferin-component ligase, partial [uncultured Solirubrobacteraceae bacterium]